MNARLMGAVLPLVAAAAIAGCGGGTGHVGPAMGCATYNTGKTNGDQYAKNTSAVSDLLTAHGINPGGNHHYDSAAGSSMMNVTVATEEIDSYCGSHPDSTIDQGIDWSNFKK